MIQKDQVIKLVKEFKQRSGQKYKDVIARMDTMPGVIMSQGVFESKFRRFPERQTIYDVKEIVALIEVFSRQGKVVCSPFEAILLCSWTGVSVGALGDVKKFFEKIEFDAALVVSMQIEMNKIRWFDPEERIWIQNLLAQEKAKHTENVDAIERAELDAPSFSPFLTVLNNPLQKPPSVQYGKFDQLGQRGIARLIDQAADDIRAGHHQNAEDFLIEILHKADHRFTSQIRDANHNLGVIQIKKGNYAEADKYLHTAFNLTGDSDAAPQARILADEGANAFAQGLYSDAESKYLRSLSIANDVENHNLISFLKNSLATVAHESGQYNRAAQYYEDARLLALESSNIPRLAYIYKGLGSVSENFNNAKLSEQFYLKGREYAKQLGHVELFAQFNWLIGSLQTIHGQPLEGERKLKESAALAMDTTLPVLWANILITLGRFYIQSHIWKLAIDTFCHALSTAMETQNYELTAKAIYGIALAQIAEKQIIGTNDVRETLRHIGPLKIDSSFLDIPPQALHKKFLLKAQRSFQLDLINFPGLERYKLVEALQLLLQ